MTTNIGHPFLFDIIKRRWLHAGVTYQEDVGVGVHHSTKLLPFFLTGGIEQFEIVRCVRIAMHHASEIVEHGRLVRRWKFI